MELTIEERDGIQLASISGELDTFGAQSVREELGLVRSTERLVIDLSELAFVDSAGLHALFAVGRGAKDVGARVAFVVPASSPIRRVIELVHLADVSPVCDAVDQALERLRGGEEGFAPDPTG